MGPLCFAHKPILNKDCKRWAYQLSIRIFLNPKLQRVEIVSDHTLVVICCYCQGLLLKHLLIISDSDEEGEEEYKLAKKPIDVASKPGMIHPRAEERCEPTNIPELSNSFLGVKKSKKTSKQDRRGSDWTEIKISQSEEDGEGPGSRRRSLPISRRRLSSVSSLSDVFDAMNSLLANDLIAVRRKANQAAISVLYDDSGNLIIIIIIISEILWKSGCQISR